jgi:hypothetical protein
MTNTTQFVGSLGTIFSHPPNKMQVLARKWDGIPATGTTLGKAESLL